MKSFVQVLKRAMKSCIAVWRRRWAVPALPIATLTADAAVVIAPHPDDETFGAGGLIALKRQMGAAVRIVFLTSGEASLVAHGGVSAEVVSEARRRQAIAACQALGVEEQQLRWLGLRDGAIPRGAEDAGFDQAVERLVAELSECPRAEIVAPHPHDALPDHEAAAELVHAALGRLQPPPRLVHYPVWAWFNIRGRLGRTLDFSRAWKLDVRPAWEAKLAAIRCYTHADRAPGGHPYCGYLPYGVVAPASSKIEVYFEGILGIDSSRRTGRGKI